MAEHEKQVLKTLTSNAFNEIRKGKTSTHSFKVDFTDVSPDFEGVFTVHRPSVMEDMQIGVIKSQLLGGVKATDVRTDNIAFIVASLEVVTDESPDWFDVFSPDINYEILESVYMEYQEWVNSFRRDVGKPTDGTDSPESNSKDTLEDNGEV